MKQEDIEKLIKKLPLNISSRKLHLGIFAEPYLTYMLDGRKTIESRFSKNKIAPYDKIGNEDIVFIKKSSGPVIGYFTIKKIRFYDLNETKIEEIRKQYQNELCVNEEFWNQKKDSNYATLIFIDKLIKFEPIYISKRGMQSWIIMK